MAVCKHIASRHTQDDEAGLGSVRNLGSANKGRPIKVSLEMVKALSVGMGPVHRYTSKQVSTDRQRSRKQRMRSTGTCGCSQTNTTPFR